MTEAIVLASGSTWRHGDFLSGPELLDNAQRLREADLWEAPSTC